MPAMYPAPLNGKGGVAVVFTRDDRCYRREPLAGRIGQPTGAWYLTPRLRCT